MSLVTINGELYHYGIPGMRWGRRKAKSKSGSNDQMSRREQKEFKRTLKKQVRSESEKYEQAKHKQIAASQVYRNIQKDLQSGKIPESEYANAGYKIQYTLLQARTAKYVHENYKEMYTKPLSKLNVKGMSQKEAEERVNAIIKEWNNSIDNATNSAAADIKNLAKSR